MSRDPSVVDHTSVAAPYVTRVVPRVASDSAPRPLGPPNLPKARTRRDAREVGLERRAHFIVEVVDANPVVDIGEDCRPWGLFGR